ncbi:MAG: hypothetical protein ACRENL_08440 [Candidatus Dormibacteria bacterium]
MSLTRALRGQLAGRDDDARRSRRVAAVLQLVERFVYDLGLLIGGRAVDLDTYVEPVAATRLRDALEPALAAGAVTQPDFGEYAQVRVEGDLLNLAEPVRAVVEFDDRSTRLDGTGGAMVRLRRRVRLQLVIDPAVTMILDHRLEMV